MFIRRKVLDNILNQNKVLDNILNQNKEFTENMKRLENYCDNLNNKISKQSVKMFDLENPNGRYCRTKQQRWVGFYYNPDMIDTFDYSYNDTIISIELPYNDMDYTKTKEGYIFVNKDRDKAYLIKFGSEECISIPYPCVCGVNEK